MVRVRDQDKELKELKDKELKELKQGNVHRKVTWEATIHDHCT